jgi:hypothetical protein
MVEYFPDRGINHFCAFFRYCSNAKWTVSLSTPSPTERIHCDRLPSGRTNMLKRKDGVLNFNILYLLRVYKVITHTANSRFGERTFSKLSFLRAALMASMSFWARSGAPDPARRNTVGRCPAGCVWSSIDTFILSVPS